MPSGNIQCARSRSTLQEHAYVRDRLCIAREPELSRLNAFLDQALAGQRQICFVTGEAGSGKSTLVHKFSRRAEIAHLELITTFGICNA